MRTATGIKRTTIELDDGIDVEVTIMADYDWEDNGNEQSSGWVLSGYDFDIEAVMQESDLTERQVSELKVKVIEQVDSIQDIVE